MTRIANFIMLNQILYPHRLEQKKWERDIINSYFKRSVAIKGDIIITHKFLYSIWYMYNYGLILNGDDPKYIRTRSPIKDVRKDEEEGGFKPKIFSWTEIKTETKTKIIFKT